MTTFPGRRRSQGRGLVAAGRSLTIHLPRNAGLVTICDHTFSAALLKRGGLVIDLGANHGAFARAMAEDFECQVRCVEPDPVLFARLPRHPKIKTLEAAVSGRDGTSAFYLSEDREANSLDPLIAEKHVARGSTDVRCASLQTCLTWFGVEEVDLLKVDIEGAEIDMFAAASDLLLSRMKQITIEFHDFFSMERYGRAVRQAAARLGRLGFLRFNISYPFHKDVLFIHRREAARLTHRQRLSLEMLARFVLPVRAIRGSLLRKLHLLGGT